MEMMNLAVLKDVRGHCVKMDQLRYAGTQGRPVTVAMKADHRMGEILATRGSALVLHADNLNFWRCRTASDFLNMLKARAAESRDPSLVSVLDKLDLQTVESLSKDIDDTSEEVDEKTLNPRMQAALVAARKAADVLPAFINKQSGERVMPRYVRAGKSDTAEAWTDGKRIIWVDLRLLKNLHKDRYGADYLAGVLLHEYGHAFENSKGHDHDFDFHHSFHEVALLKDKGVLGRVAEQMRRRYVASLGQRLESLPKWAFDSYETEKVKEIHVSRSGSAVSKAAEIMLKASGAKVDMKPSKAILMMENSRSDNIQSKMVTAFWKILRKDKRLSMDRKTVFDQIQKEFYQDCKALSDQGATFTGAAHQVAGVRDEKLALVWEQFEAALASWLKDNDQDEMLAYQILKASTLNDFLNLLCSDVQSDFGQYSYSQEVTEYVRGGREYQFVGTRDDARKLCLQWSNAEDNVAESLAAGADRRLDKVQQGMFQSLMMIENEMERDTAAKKLLGEDSYKAFRAFADKAEATYSGY